MKEKLELSTVYGKFGNRKSGEFKFIEDIDKTSMYDTQMIAMTFPTGPDPIISSKSFIKDTLLDYLKKTDYTEIDIDSLYDKLDIGCDITKIIDETIDVLNRLKEKTNNMKGGNMHGS